MVRSEFFISGVIVTLALIFVTAGCADEPSSGNVTGAERWIGTWTDATHTLVIEQNGTELIGIGTPFDPEINYPFRFFGTITDDGTLLQTVMKDSGTRELHISDDQMSFSGTGTVDPYTEDTEPFTYSINATRIGTTIQPDTIWDGEWLTVENTSITFNQSGNSITGIAYPILDPEYIEEFEGITSDDGKTMFINWTFSQDVDFILSDDGMNIIETECGEDEIAKGQICFNLTKTN